ncbi:hypothetical protein [Kitasatospora azatica]|uniref:hypothetical protein n=1 Tax=Kitasatospora azatica TaxID=58347 RepID=UPI00068F368C|nr:hypothetical protein [Kitasatospora azatica]
MTEFTSHTLALCDEYARKRYGNYLAQHRRDFVLDGEPLPPGHFAAVAWRIATSPVMAPGYVRLRPDVDGIYTTFTDDGELLLSIDVPLRHRVLANRPRVEFSDWWQQRTYCDDGRFTDLIEPEELRGRPALLLTAAIVVPVPEDLLPRPTTTQGAELIAQAKEAVHTLVDLVNTQAKAVNELAAGGAR